MFSARVFDNVCVCVCVWHNPLCSDDDFDWEANDEEIRLERERQKREREQAMRAKKSHPVHCPHFPEPKQEFWWVFLADEQNGRMITAPVKVTNLVDREEVDIKFQAPPRPGTYKLQLYVVAHMMACLPRCLCVVAAWPHGSHAMLLLTMRL